ncbi:unnamed protein product [Pleuronectes platessa]|uniref:ADP-ribosyl cyclase/cyclic ADP-ribose hydrolase n=1 Tax=Pleuronectes platessa TaxID=8262 RepID=A0A9N7VNG3_PLEPL|nr:unnamed protein product [Pleuronectes platessa]
MCSQRTYVILGVVGVIITVAVVLTLPLKGTFIRRCKGFKKYDCENLWSVFQQAYVGKDPCNVPTEAYDPLIATAPFKPACNRHFTKKRECFLTLEKTLLGSVLRALTWCGEEGSSETFTSGCPDWRKCENNPVDSFWRSASAAFADVACGDVTAVLDGSIETPFDPKSIFGSIELKRFKSPRVRSLKIVLVSQKKAV